MQDNIYKWLELDQYITDNRKYMTEEEYQEYIQELYKLYNIIINN